MPIGDFPEITKVHFLAMSFGVEDLPHWQALLDDVKAAINAGEEPSSPNGKALAKRWMYMLAEDSEDIVAKSDLGTDEAIPKDPILHQFLSDARTAVRKDAVTRNSAALAVMIRDAAAQWHGSRLPPRVEAAIAPYLDPPPVGKARPGAF